MILKQDNLYRKIKNLSIDDLNILAAEIREVLISKTSKVGGHIASNLGVVELTIALHYVFNSPVDKFIFDVFHQSYVHKILTGRAKAFTEEEHYNDVSGFSNPDESEHDHFRIGHTATSISLASGMAKARDLAKRKENIIAIIGDGSLSGGEALEGLDFVSTDIKSNLIIILNDNQMSIAENHGGIYSHFSELRRMKGKSQNNIFKSLGYDYRFIENGNNISEVIEVLKTIKDIDHPVVVHICTNKGQGYKFAEENKELFHWATPFFRETGMPRSIFNGERYDKIARDFLVEKMKNDRNIATIIAAVPGALAFDPETRKGIGEQFIDVGIAEEHAIAMAAGMAKSGAKPVFVTLSTFYQRTYDQISQELCINKCPATLLVANASVYAVGEMTHVGIFDIPMMSNIPNLVYLAPTNKEEYIAMLDWSIEQNKFPVAIRAPRNGVFHTNDIVDSDYSDLNKYKITRYGQDIAIIALGDFYQLGEEVCDKLTENNINATLINPRFITGLDIPMLENLKKKHKVIITLEDGILDGGFGEKIARYYGSSKMKVINKGLKKEFLDRYNVNIVMQDNRLKPNQIVEDILISLND